MVKRTKQFIVYKEVGNYEYGFQVYDTPIIPTRSHIICDQIKSYIKSNNIEEIQKLLSKDFIYPGCLKKNAWTNLSPKREDILKEEYELYAVKPILEALFFEFNELFFQLLNAIIKSKNEELYKIFIDEIEKTDIPRQVLSRWTTETVKKVHYELKELEKYSDILLKEHSIKGHHALALSKNLKALMASAPDCKENDVKSKVEWLHFKLTFMKELHTKDEIFAPHRGWKRFFANLAALIFSGCLLNGFKYCLTKEWFFCNQTTTQKRVNNLHQIVTSGNRLNF